MTLKEILTEARNLNIQEQIQLASQLLEWIEMKGRKHNLCKIKKTNAGTQPWLLYIQ